MESLILSRRNVSTGLRWVNEVSAAAETVEVDARGLECPMPLLKAKRALNAMAAGQVLRVLATDKGSVRDFRVFTEQSGHVLLSSEESEGVYTHLLQKS